MKARPTATVERSDREPLGDVPPLWQAFLLVVLEVSIFDSRDVIRKRFGARSPQLRGRTVSGRAFSLCRSRTAIE